MTHMPENNPAAASRLHRKILKGTATQMISMVYKKNSINHAF